MLAAVGGNLSCLFLHLRDCPVMTSRLRLPPPADGVAADIAE